jgi:hypothetical protein
MVCISEILYNYVFTIGDISSSYILCVGTTCVFISTFYYEQEAAFMEIYDMNTTNEKEKLKWISVLDTLPFFVVIYDKLKQKITYINNHISNTMFPT